MDTKIDDFIQKFIKMKEASVGLPLSEARALSKEFFHPASLPLESVQKVVNVSVPVSGYNIPLRLFIPEGQGPFPVLMYFHGGGWVFGSNDQSESQCRNLANGSTCIVAAVEYRLAPEFPFPIPLEDCYQATAWMSKHAADFDGDSTKLGIMGDSAGGNLAAAVALLARDRHGPSIIYQALLFPVVTNSLDKKVFTRCSDQRFLTYDSMEWFWNSYLQSPQDKDNLYAAPLKAPDLSGLPPALVITAECDPLGAEGEQYVNRLRQANVPVVAKKYPGMIHCFILLPIDFELKKQALKEIAAELRSSLYRCC